MQAKGQYYMQAKGQLEQAQQRGEIDEQAQSGRRPRGASHPPMTVTRIEGGIGDDQVGALQCLRAYEAEPRSDIDIEDNCMIGRG